MPNTVNFERHKLNQAMYQKLKRYIMSKRKRELEEKAQDDHFKKLRREREERKMQAEFDAEDLEKTRIELQSTRAKIKELTARRNELFQRWKQLGTEECNQKEKQRSEALALLAGMQTTQFGISSGGLGTASRSPISTTVPRTQTSTHIQPPQLPHLPQGKQFGIGSNVMGPCVSLPAQHLIHPHYSNSATRDAVSPHRGLQGPPSHSSTKSNQVPTAVSSALPGSVPLPCVSLPSNQAAAVAAVAAAIASQHRAGNPTDSLFANRAAAAYLNAIVSLTSTTPTSVPSLSSAPLGVLNPGSVGFNEALAALAASGFYSVPSVSPQSGGNVVLGASIGRNASPSNAATIDSSISKNGRANIASQAAAAAVAALTQQSMGLTKNFSLGQRHSTNNVLDASISVPSVTTTSVSATVTSSSLPPAPISYRGSITTGQSAQQIQLQQQQHQQQAHQKQLLSKFTLGSDFVSSRSINSSQQTDGSMGGGSSRSALSACRLTDAAAAFIASMGVSSSSALLNATALQSGFASSTTSSSSSLQPAQSPIALTAVLTPYSSEVNPFSYLNSATLAASLQQQQQLQKRNLPPSSSPHARNSPANQGANPSSTARHF